MEIKQFEDKNLAHYSYAIVSKGEVALIDPARDPQPYYDFAAQHQSKITHVIETHPHADFVSSHLEIHETTGASIHVSKLLGAEYKHLPFDGEDEIKVGDVTLKALNTPGHSPDSISIVLRDESGKERAVFTGDTLFIGDCGRPDLREKAGAITAQREDLAKQMYYSLRNELMTLPDSVIVYPAHGAGSLCGKGLSEESASTIGEQKKTNWSLQPMMEQQFVKALLEDQPFVPQYFPYDVAVNKKGASAYQSSIQAVKRRAPISCEGCINSLETGVVIIDTRPQEAFKKSHIKGAFNLMNDTKFETWLGSIVAPGEKFYLLGESDESLDFLIRRIAKIGYEAQIVMAFTTRYGNETTETFDASRLRKHPEAYTIVDVRNPSEVRQQKIFASSISIPLYELRERVEEIPRDKPIVVHCAGGYRSAAASSIIAARLEQKVKVFDLSEAIKEFSTVAH